MPDYAATWYNLGIKGVGTVNRTADSKLQSDAKAHTRIHVCGCELGRKSEACGTELYCKISKSRML